jgi:hypothetical protein
MKQRRGKCKQKSELICDCRHFVSFGEDTQSRRVRTIERKCRIQGKQLQSNLKKMAKILNYDSINQQMKKCRYDVRGEIYLAAVKRTAEGKGRN